MKVRTLEPIAAGEKAGRHVVVDLVDLRLPCAFWLGMKARDPF